MVLHLTKVLLKGIVNERRIGDFKPLEEMSKMVRHWWYSNTGLCILRYPFDYCLHVAMQVQIFF